MRTSVKLALALLAGTAAAGFAIAQTTGGAPAATGGRPLRPRPRPRPQAVRRAARRSARQRVARLQSRRSPASPSLVRPWRRLRRGQQQQHRFAQGLREPRQRYPAVLLRIGAALLVIAAGIALAAYLQARAHPYYPIAQVAAPRGSAIPPFRNGGRSRSVRRGEPALHPVPAEGLPELHGDVLALRGEGAGGEASARDAGASARRAFAGHADRGRRAGRHREDKLRAHCRRAN